MSIFSSIKYLGNSIAKGVGTVTSAVASTVITNMTYLAGGFTHPLQTAAAVVSPKSTIKEVVEKHADEPLKQQTKETVVASLAYGTTALTGGTTLGQKLALAAAKKALPTTVGGAVLTGAGLYVGAPIIAGQIAAHPEGAAKAIENLPMSAAEGSKDIYNLSKNPTAENALQFLKEHPYLTATTATALLLAAGYASIKVGQIVSTYYNTKAINASTDTTKHILEDGLPTSDKDKKDKTVITKIPDNAIAGQTINIYNTPQTPTVGAVAPPIVPPVTTTAPKKTTKKKKKTTKKKKKTTKKKKKTTKKKKKTTKKKKKKSINRRKTR